MKLFFLLFAFKWFNAKSVCMFASFKLYKCLLFCSLIFTVTNQFYIFNNKRDNKLHHVFPEPYFNTVNHYRSSVGKVLGLYLGGLAKTWQLVVTVISQKYRHFIYKSHGVLWRRHKNRFAVLRQSWHVQEPTSTLPYAHHKGRHLATSRYYWNFLACDLKPH